ncbi:alcohol-forming fatty acyl-CoA reductase-like [Gossypium australe]|uniref:Alcohol-forming fatty acyl-CoA reductase-like n=1 Tax=Gossypium australe TaxID=47621 RepID=A0A5B6UVY7_9ROSI|nr:alcohol-forming fatty acyl-CoA reductase-like [Gossypium australe]
MSESSSGSVSMLRSVFPPRLSCAKELKEFVVLFDRACKAGELSKEKRRAKIETRDSRKRPMSKSFQSQSKKSRDLYARSIVSAGYSNREREKQYSSSKAQTPSVASVGNSRSSRPESSKSLPVEFTEFMI